MTKRISALTLTCTVGAVLGALFVIVPNASAQAVPQGYKSCSVASPCDQPMRDGTVVCPYINSDDNVMKARIYGLACKGAYGKETGYTSLSGHPACVIQTLVPENANCP
jgi:hypothetical protein